MFQRAVLNTRKLFPLLDIFWYEVAAFCQLYKLYNYEDLYSELSSAIAGAHRACKNITKQYNIKIKDILNVSNQTWSLHYNNAALGDQCTKLQTWWSVYQTADLVISVLVTTS